MENREKASNALLAVFPTSEAFHQFAASSDGISVAESFVEFGKRKRLIGSRDRESLAAFIQGRSVEETEEDVPGNLTFEEVLHSKEELLNLKISVRAWTDRINSLIEEEQIDLPKVSNSMLTRLKKEPADTLYKQNVLRSLAFWIGHERGELGRRWNYDTLVRLCNENRAIEHFNDGVRVGFSLSSRGDFIDQNVVGWLKRALRDYFDKGFDVSVRRSSGKIRSYNITTFYIDFPREGGGTGLAPYRQSLKSAVSLAHHMAIRWALSDYCTKKRFLAIGIVAGEYAGLDSYLLCLLNAKLAGDPVIRVSDYARQYLLINDVRVILSEKPTEIALANEEVLFIWSVIGLWNFIYFDFIPDLLEDPILQNDRKTIKMLNQTLWFSDEQGAESEIHGNAVIKFLKSPQNSLLGTEIAKTLYFRRRFPEAIEILRIVLSINPADLVARTLRMVIFRDMALDAPTYSGAESIFRMAEQEASYLQQNSVSRSSEDFYCEYGIACLARALTAMKESRRKGVASEPGAVPGRIFFSSLEKAEDLFEKGMTVSPSGIRSFYLLGSVRVLKALVRADEKILTESGRLSGKSELIQEQTANLFRQRGYFLSENPTKEQQDLLERLIMKKSIFHNDSVSLQAYRPTISFTGAVMLWDYFPVRTVGLARKVLRYIQEAIRLAREIEGEGICIYSFSRMYGEVMSTGKFIEHMMNSIACVKEAAGENLAERPEDEIIERTGDRMELLMTLNFGDMEVD